MPPKLQIHGGKEKKTQRRRRSSKKKYQLGNRLRLILFPLNLLILVVLPFFLLIRTSVFLYGAARLNTWLALGFGMALTSACLLFYVQYAYKKLFRKRRIKKKVKKYNLRLAAAVVIVYCASALIYISSVNVKAQRIRNEYAALHPLLRIAVSSVVLADTDLVVTDMARTHGDYNRMGLQTMRRSLHYRQRDHYVHAVDLRTMGQAEWRNHLLTWYFDLMGLRTLRHVGTADHLHVSLPLP